MNFSRSLTAAIGAAVLFVPIGSALGSVESQQIDRSIEDGLARSKSRPNKPSTDEEFLRRLYLDIIGRIPTYEEAKEFLDHEAPNKRSLLIRELLNSEGYVSHTFNWWADILRLKTGGSAEINASGSAYANWVKNAIAENMPYDQFVRELVNPTKTDPKTGDKVTGEPVFAWDNGAAGYYMRDSGMPLDNMSNTIQVFMGTRLVCAQCHDHPFDKWSQMDYHQMAAYSYNSVDTRVRPESVLPGIRKKLDRKNRREEDRYFRDAINDLFQPLNYGVMPTERKHKLPHDYRSEKSRGKPYDEVTPSTKGFKDAPSAGKGKGSRLLDNYSNWLTARDNQRFNKVIANRLWKRVFGRGLVEPVDDWTDDTEPANRYVMDQLTRLVVQKRYDLKAVLEILYNTRTYQRQTFGDDIPEDTHFAFPGPVLRRMSGDQIWDSFMTVAVPDIDDRVKSRANGSGRKLAYQNEAEKLLAMEEASIIKLAEDIAELSKAADPKVRKLRDEGGKQKEINRITKERDQAIAKLKADAFQMAANDSMMMMQEETMMEEKDETPSGEKKANNWQGYDKGFVRSSELSSPAPIGHFLRQFGQSDRETIEAATNQPSVDQALTLLNSPIFDQMFHDKSKIAQDLAKASSMEEKQDIIFLGLLSRYPRDADRELMNKQIAKYGESKAFKNITWALMNTQEFVFFQ